MLFQPPARSAGKAPVVFYASAPPYQPQLQHQVAPVKHGLRLLRPVPAAPLARYSTVGPGVSWVVFQKTASQFLLQVYVQYGVRRYIVQLHVYIYIYIHIGVLTHLIRVQPCFCSFFVVSISLPLDAYVHKYTYIWCRVAVSIAPPNGMGPPPTLNPKP